MSNVISVTNEQKPPQTIAQMVPGQVGYTVPWAYQDGELNENYQFVAKHGMSTLRVECVYPGKYAITFEGWGTP